MAIETRASQHPHRHGSPEARAKAAARLRSIEGHIRGVKRMVDDGAYCIDIIKQIIAVQRAVDKVNALLLEDHLRHCATNAIRAADPAERERTVSELLEVFEMSSKL
ncbi:MAG TPA: metal-sensitive transcriptional regulator [bacterium]|jgi:DNA-binding FrmR family transcriptional regulator